jgi:hypothetical protein
MFNAPSIYDHFRQIQESVRGDILRESDEQILGSDTDALAKYHYDRYAMSPIEEDKEREANYDLQNYLKDIPAHRREEFYRQEGDLRNFPSQRAFIEVPIVPNKDINVLSQLQSSTRSLSYSNRDFNWDEAAISTSFETKGYQFEMDAGRIGNEINQALQRIRSAIIWMNADIEKGNRELLTYIENLINERKQKLLQDREKIEALTKNVSIPLRKKSTSGAHLIRVDRSPLVQRVKPKPTLPEEYVLDEGRVNDIVELLDNQARSFEHTPKAFKTLGEEDLRDVLLSNLNSVFEGGATGETFSKNGKTDIYLKIAKGNILIAECKIWAGAALYADTLDQLRRYLTWRHNYGIMITFVRIKDFTKSLRESEGAIQKHGSFTGGFKTISETHFVSNHRVDDADKHVKVHHLFYHLYCNE